MYLKQTSVPDAAKSHIFLFSILNDLIVKILPWKCRHWTEFTGFSAVSFLLLTRRLTQRRTTLSCCTEATSTTPAVPISGSTVWSPNRRASSCPTSCERRLQLLGLRRGCWSPSERCFYLTLPQASGHRSMEGWSKSPPDSCVSPSSWPPVFTTCCILQVCSLNKSPLAVLLLLFSSIY